MCLCLQTNMGLCHLLFLVLVTLVKAAEKPKYAFAFSQDPKLSSLPNRVLQATENAFLTKWQFWPNFQCKQRFDAFQKDIGSSRQG